jgi:8-oxo-dGTP pyrophosphatase MutT (NUDIX family)
MSATGDDSTRSTNWNGVSLESAEVEATRAAGGIVCREDESGIRILAVHRPRYDDWSLPKGHVDPGETLEAAALREVHEETGYRCEMTGLAGIASYTTGTGEHKVVHYWVMSVIDGTFAPNDEVDRIAWVSPDEAIDLLSYDLDRDLIRTTLDTA